MPSHSPRNARPGHARRSVAPLASATAPVPVDPRPALQNPARLAALDASGALDVDARAPMDRLTRLVAHAFGAPTALVSLVADDCQVFTGRTGLAEPWATTRTTPLSHSFCQHVVAGAAPLAVTDARTHPVLAGNAAVEDLGVVAYLGVPLVTADQHVIGSLCVIDDSPRAWTDADLALLSEFATSVQTELRFRVEVREHEKTATTLQAHAAQHRALLEALPLIVYQASPEPPYSPAYVSQSIETLGYTRDEWMATPDLWTRMLHPDDRERVLVETERAIAAGDGITYDYRVLAKDGTVRWIHDRGAFVRDAAGRPTMWQGILLDRTAQRIAEQALREREAQLSLIYHHTSNLLFLIEVAAGVPLDAAAFRCVSINQPYLDLIGLPEDRVAGRLVADLLPLEAMPLVLDRYCAAIAAGAPIQYEEAHDLPLGRRVFETTLVPIHNDAGRCTHLVGVASDVTHRQQAAAELWHQAHHDALTGLANRTFFRERVARALDRASATPPGDSAGVAPHQAAVLFLDLDDFKDVNDSSGHATGDALLVAAAERLLNATRGCDTVARLGGDEFAILIEHVAHERDLMAVADRVAGAFRAPFRLCGLASAAAPDAAADVPSEVHVSASVGIACGAAGDNPDAVLRNADLAMYHAKATGKGRHALFEPAMHATAAERLALAADLRHAVARDQLRVQFQPIVDLETGRMAGAEALLRWHHPQRGLVSPAEFIPVAETTGSIVGLGRWVLDVACREAATWARGYVSVNLSGRQLDDPGLIDDVVAALAGSGLDARRLLLEITETALMRDAEAVLGTLTSLKALGVRLAVDDFGTGYSSLAYLQRFPVDVLKLDRAFVRGVARGSADVALARAVVALGSSLQLTTVAEGIETPEQAAQLRALGCPLGQGFLYARPMDAAALAAWRCGGQALNSGGRSRRASASARRTPSASRSLP